MSLPDASHDDDPDAERPEVPSPPVKATNSPSEPLPLDERPAATEGDTYDLEESEEALEDDAPVPPIPPVAVPPSATKPERSKGKRPRLEPVDPSEAVPVVWSRWGEWRSTLLRLAKVGLGGLVLILLTLQIGAYSFAFILLLITTLGLVVLSYPIMITLERPVRFTPEQAVNDYYAALSHRLPHYDRMWLLLAGQGKTCEEFSTPEEFRVYWEGVIDRLSGASERRFNPLRFKVSGFHSEKSGGATAVRVSYSVDVSRRGADPGTDRSSPSLETILVRGPDKMWYLTDGRLPEPSE